MGYLPTLLPQQPQQPMSRGMSPLMPQQPTPNFNNGTAPGGIAAMVNAIMAGQDQFNQRRGEAVRQAQGAQQLNPTTTTGGPSVGAPMSLAPPMTPPSAPIPPRMVDPGPMTGSMGGMPTPNPNGLMGVPVSMNASAGMPGMPNGIDPSMQALFSKIPGEGSQFGG